VRAAIDGIAGADAAELFADARDDAIARVRTILSDAMTESLLEHIVRYLAPSAEVTPDVELREPRGEGTELAWYVYGIVAEWAAPAKPLSGVDGAYPVMPLREGELTAMASQVPVSEFDGDRLQTNLAEMAWVEAVARAHDRVLAAIHRQTTVVPMRLCTMYRTEDALREMLRREAMQLSDAIEHLDGTTEWGLKVWADPNHMPAPPVGERAADAQPALGTAYMQRRRDERDQRQQAGVLLHDAAARIHERLWEVCEDGVVAAPGRVQGDASDGEMILNAAYLVADDADERFRQRLRELCAELGPAGMEFEMTGPWPPYNFVPAALTLVS
jgi:hypothetical protein